ncbi:tetratricopeptide repeat protein [Novosphingopyxis sp.]|uniref:tetratricopeptide repeat protein n=1 Tax=Novosphingopyxis sp. TaxID=2709690 RepID=UPI003B5AAE5B
MRFSPAAIALSLGLAMVSSAGLSKPDMPDVNPRALALADRAAAAASSGDYEGAIGLYETALTVDPAFQQAFVSLADIARAQGLDGKAIRLYRESLKRDPNDETALAGEGRALAERGALERAREDLARLRLLCRTRCDVADALSLAIDQAAARPVRSAEAVTPATTVEEAERRAEERP